MTSPSSGYITAGANISLSDEEYLERTVTVLEGNIVIVSYKELAPHLVDIKLLYHSMDYDDSVGYFRVVEFEAWDRMTDFVSDFASVLHATRIITGIFKRSCVKTKTNCFRVFFSFIAKHEAPQKLPSGLWNCSVDHYAGFHHHLACNHHTECEDGRDETEHCPFSSPDCQGLVSFHNRCYKFVRNVNDVHTSELITFATKYCNSLGGELSFPFGVCDWFGALKNLTKMHEYRLQWLWGGLYSNDMSLPSMYRHEVMNKRSAFYNNYNIDTLNKRRLVKKCYLSKTGSLLSTCDCRKNKLRRHLFGLVCEFRQNRTASYSSHLRSIPLTSAYRWPTGQNSVTKCIGGHVTHTFLLCGSNKYELCEEERTNCNFSEPSYMKTRYPGDHSVDLYPTFMCSHELTTLSYTLVCDFMIDCQDKSDESLCTYPVCMREFTCFNGQCVPYISICDYISHCQDESDERNCDQFRIITVQHTCIPSPTVVNFDGLYKFTSKTMNSTEPCPDSHYRCPGEFNNCLPVYTRCNQIYDCIDYQDEEGCEDLTCPGFFRCRKSAICVHSDHLCDGWFHCPMRDDELLCNVICPTGCLCSDHTFLCFQPFSVTFFPQIRYLNASGSGMTLTDVNDHANIIHLILAKCNLSFVPNLIVRNLRFLDLNSNKFQHINVTNFLGLKHLQILSLSNNPLTSLSADFSSVLQQHTLTIMDLSCTFLTELQTDVFSGFRRLRKLLLNFTSIQTVTLGGFRFVPQLTELNMDGSPLKTFPFDIFKGLTRLQIIFTTNYKLCCSEILPSNFVSCIAPKNEIASCEDLLHSWTYRGFLWLIACLSLTGNLFCFCVRFYPRAMATSSGFRVFVINLTMADFLMGVYVAMIGVADESFRGKYLHHDEIWKRSVTCQIAGVLSLLSSEVSALVIWLITLDRFIVLHFPFSTVRFERTSASVACLLTWVMGWTFALLPLLPVTSHWEFYSQTGICIPLPVTRQEFKGKAYSFSVMIVLNFILFLFISVGQALIYWSVQVNALKTNTTKMSRDITIAQRLIAVAVTDFMCWFPIGMCGILALAGVPIPGELNVALAVFILPLNSAVNPFMYTFNTLAKKRRKSNEAKLLAWCQSHSDLIT